MAQRNSLSGRSLFCQLDVVKIIIDTMCWRRRTDVWMSYPPFLLTSSLRLPHTAGIDQGVVLWVVGVWFFGLFGLCLFCFWFCLVACLVLCCRLKVFPCFLPSHKSCEASRGLSEWTLDLHWRLRSLVRCFVVSLPQWIVCIREIYRSLKKKLRGSKA